MQDICESNERQLKADKTFIHRHPAERNQPPEKGLPDIHFLIGSVK